MIKLSCEPFKSYEDEYNADEKRFMLLALLEKSNELFIHTQHNEVCLKHITDNIFVIALETVMSSKRLSINTKGYLIDTYMTDYIAFIATNLNLLTGGTPINKLASEINKAHEAAKINDKIKNNPIVDFNKN